MKFPQWLEEKHELYGGTMYTVGSPMLYSILELDGNRVVYSMRGTTQTKNSKEFKTEKAAKRFYIESARAMRACAKRGTIPLWHHLV